MTSFVRMFLSVLAVAVCWYADYAPAEVTESSHSPARSPLTTGRFSWMASQPLEDPVSGDNVGFDERLEVNDYQLEVMFQAFDAADTPDTYDYDNLPWELLIMRNY